MRQVVVVQGTEGAMHRFTETYVNINQRMKS